MVEPVSLQTLLTYLTLISVPVGVFYHILTLRNQSKSRQIQILNSAYSKEINWDFADWNFNDYDDFMSKHGPQSDPEGWRDVLIWFNLLEGFGVYVREGLLDVRLVCLFSGGTIRNTREKYREVFMEHRIRTNHPRFFRD